MDNDKVLNKHLENLATLIEQVNDLHANLLVHGLGEQADTIAMIREEMFWLYHELGSMD